MAVDGVLWAEDLEVGAVLNLGNYTVTRAEIIAFAEQWDPQPFHVDVDQARNDTFGDVIGSGLHTLAIYQRLAVAAAYADWAVVAGRALRNVEFTSPLLPDSELNATLTIDWIEFRSPTVAMIGTTGKVRSDAAELLTSQVEVLVRRRPVEMPNI